MTRTLTGKQIQIQIQIYRQRKIKKKTHENTNSTIIRYNKWGTAYAAKQEKEEKAKAKSSGREMPDPNKVRHKRDWVGLEFGNCFF